jgi:hypothetical protein
MKPALRGVASRILLTTSLLLAGALAQNPVPQIVGPVHPMAVAPGGGDFTLSVYGANFVPGAVVNWNYQPRATTYISGHELQTQILSTDIAKNTAGTVGDFNSDGLLDVIILSDAGMNVFLQQ